MKSSAEAPDRHVEAACPAFRFYNPPPAPIPGRTTKRGENAYEPTEGGSVGAPVTVSLTVQINQSLDTGGSYCGEPPFIALWQVWFVFCSF